MVVQAQMKRTSYRGVVDVIYGGEKPEKPELSSMLTNAEKNKGKSKAQQQRPENGQKRKAGPSDEVEEKIIENGKPMSKREQKRQAKKAKLEMYKNPETTMKAQSAPVPPQAADSLTEGLITTAIG